MSKGLYLGIFCIALAILLGWLLKLSIEGTFIVAIVFLLLDILIFLGRLIDEVSKKKIESK